MILFIQLFFTHASKGSDVMKIFLEYLKTTNKQHLFSYLFNNCCHSFCKQQSQDVKQILP